MAPCSFKANDAETMNLKKVGQHRVVRSLIRYSASVDVSANLSYLPYSVLQSELGDDAHQTVMFGIERLLGLKDHIAALGRNRLRA